MTERPRDPVIAVLDLTDFECRTQLLRLWRRAYQVEADLIGLDGFPPLLVSLDALAARPGTFYGAFREQRLLGAIEVEQLSPTMLQISALVVDPDHFRRGVARRLLQFVLDDLPTIVLVSTSPANAPALALYRSMGFRQTEPSASPHGVELCPLEWRPSQTPEIPRPLKR